MYQLQYTRQALQAIVYIPYIPVPGKQKEKKRRGVDLFIEPFATMRS